MSPAVVGWFSIPRVAASGFFLFFEGGQRALLMGVGTYCNVALGVGGVGVGFWWGALW